MEYNPILQAPGQEEIGVQSDLTYQESGVVTDLNLQTLGPQDTYRGPHD